MSSSLTLKTELNVDQKWQVTAEIAAGGDLPQSIFVYENKGEAGLGDYIGVCSVEEYQRFVPYVGTPVPMFGNRFVTFTKGVIVLPAYSDKDGVIANFTNNVKILSTNLKSASVTTETITIL